MQRQNIVEEYVTHLDGIEQCQECGHIRCDDGECHYHDCRYFSNEDEEDAVPDDSSEFELQTMPNFKPDLKHAHADKRRA